VKNRFGNETLGDISNLDENGEVMKSDNRRRMDGLGNRLWHTDASFQDPPGRYSMLSAKVIPPVAADTEYADMRATYDALDADAAELHRLYPDAHLRGKGTGRALVGAVLDWCRAQGVSRLILWSDTRFDLAHRLYTRTGFRRTGEQSLPGDVNETREYGFEREV